MAFQRERRLISERDYRLLALSRNSQKREIQSEGMHFLAALVLVGGRLIDGFGGPPLEDSVVVIEGERITAVGLIDRRHAVLESPWEVRDGREGAEKLAGRVERGEADRR